MPVSCISAVPGINKPGWDVQRTETDGSVTLLAAGLRPQQARDMAEELRREEAHIAAERRPV